MPIEVMKFFLKLKVNCENIRELYSLRIHVCNDKGTIVNGAIYKVKQDNLNHEITIPINCNLRFGTYFFTIILLQDEKTIYRANDVLAINILTESFGFMSLNSNIIFNEIL